MLSDVLIPLLTYPDADTRQTAKGLLRLAGSFAAHATLCTLEVNVREVRHRWGVAFPDVARMASEAERLSREASDSLCTVTSDATGSVVTEHTRLSVYLGEAPTNASIAARKHDLSLVSMGAPTDSHRELAELLVFESGRPTMIVPPEIPADMAFHTVAVAWDGSRTASRALHDSLPLLANAKTVILLTGQTDKALGDGEINEVSAYLGRHGITSVHQDVTHGSEGIGTALQDSAVRHGAQLMVMGAYGHNRLRQFVLGGATRSILHDLRLPVLFSH